MPARPTTWSCLAGMFVFVFLGSSCGPPDLTTLNVSSDSRELSLYATVDRAVADQGSFHLLVFRDGSARGSSIFTTLVTPERFHQALVGLGASPGNNVNAGNFDSPIVATQGTKLEVTASWDGAPKTYLLPQLLEEPTDLVGGGPHGLEIRFGGNRPNPPGENPSDETGCLACLYSCSAGVTSNAAANEWLHGRDGVWRYRGNQSTLPADGTRVKIGFRVLE